MCRVLAYLGRPILLEDLLYKPDVSFVSQTHRAAPLLLSQLPDPYADLAAQDIAAALQTTLRVLGQVRKSLGIRTFSPMNLFVSDGNDIVAACHTFDHGRYEGLGDDYHPPEENLLRIWYTIGRSYGFHGGEWRMEGPDEDASSCIIASEPLTVDNASWHMVPMQHLVYVRRTEGRPSIQIVPLDLDAHGMIG